MHFHVLRDERQFRSSSVIFFNFPFLGNEWDLINVSTATANRKHPNELASIAL